jgi:hypothetical protein
VYYFRCAQRFFVALAREPRRRDHRDCASTKALEPNQDVSGKCVARRARLGRRTQR